MIAALVVGDTVENVIVLEDGTRLTKPLAASFGGDLLIAVPADTPVGPGWGYDKSRTPPFIKPELAPVTPAAPDAAAVFPVLVAAAADPDKTLEEKVAAIVQALASAAGGPPPPSNPTG